MRIPLPFGGRHDGSARSDQPLGTSSDLLNVGPYDPRTGREGIAQRAGHTKYSSTVIGGSKVKALAPVPADTENRTYTSLGSSVTTEWSSTSRTQGSSKSVRVDRQGNAYFLDGPAALVKVNPAGVVVARLALPIADPLHEIRALHIDRFDRLYIGVSAGGAQATARIWCYAQEDDNTFRLVWQLEPGEYVEAVVTANDALYYAANRTDSNTSRIVGMSGFDVESPTTRTLRNAPYPLNDMALSPKDGALYIAAPPNSTRGYNPLSPETTAISEDWTPKNNLEEYQRRAWGYWDTTDPDGMLIIPPTGSEEDEGGVCSILYDLSGNNRHFYQGVTGTSHTGPRYRSRGIGGMPSIYFNGSSNAMESLAPTSNDKASRGEILSALPTYAGAQFVCVMVVRLAVSASGHIVLAQDSGAGTTRAIVANTLPGGAIAGANSDNSVRLFETGGTASTAAASSTAATAPAGNTTTPLPGCIGPGGLCILTWVCDGGVHDVFGSATRSLWRVNGLPCDRWQSASFSATLGARLGYSGVGAVATMAGDFSYMITIADWYDTSDTRQRLVLDNNSTQPLDTRYPDLAFSFSSSVTNDLVELEGFVAHKFGLGHLLPAGQAAWLRDTGGGNFANNDTVTINENGVAKVYRFRDVNNVHGGGAFAFGGANDVLIGSTGEVSCRNLRRAINGEGSPGISYDGATVPHTVFRAQGPITYQNSNRPCILIRAIDANHSAETIGEAAVNYAWSTATSGVVVTSDSFSASIASKNTNWYPHQYYIDKIANRTLGGPPRSEDALTAPSKPSLFVSGKYGMTAKIDPANGKVKWVATSNFDNAGLGLGGLGYGVIVSPDGDVYCCGPRQALVSTPSITAEAIDVRKLVDNGTSFSTTLGTGSTTAWQDDPGALTYQYPRMAVDKFDNLYLPNHNSAAGTSLIGYARLGTSAVANTTPLFSVTNITDDPRTYAVAVHPTIPDYPVSFTDDRAQFVYLATEKTASNVAYYKLGLISVVNTSGSPKTTTRLGVSGANIVKFGFQNITGATWTHATLTLTKAGAFTDYVFTAGDLFICTGGTGATTGTYAVASRVSANAITLSTSIGAAADGQTDIAGSLHFATVVGSGVLDTAAQLVSTAVGYKKVFFFDGRKPYYYDAVLGTVSALVAEGGGECPMDVRLGVFWRGRLFVANGLRWFASGVGKPFDWNFFPAVPNDGMAVSNTTALAGQPSDPIQSLYAINDDLILIGGMGSIRMMAGDPARPNTKIQLVTDKVGTAFGNVWARDDAGVSYFFGSDANVYAFAGGAITALTLGDSNIHEALRAIDFSAYTAQLVFDTRWQVLHVLIVPLGAGGTVVTHYRWHKPTRSWWPVQFAAAGTQYTCATALEGDTAAERLIVFGCEDGYVRKEDPASKTDDGLRMETRCLIGPIAPESLEEEMRTSALQALLDQEADGCLYELYQSSTPNRPSQPTLTGYLRPGRNNVPARMCSPHIWLMLRGLSVTPGTRYAVESVHLDVHRAGRKRHAPVR